MKPASAVQSGASVQTREASRPTLSSEAPVFEQGDQPGPRPREVRRQQQRVVLAHDAVDRVRRRRSSGRRRRSSGRRSGRAWRSTHRDGSGSPPRRTAIARASAARRSVARSSRATAAGPTRSAGRDSRPARRSRLSSAWGCSSSSPSAMASSDCPSVYRGSSVRHGILIGRPLSRCDPACGPRGGRNGRRR